MKKFPEAPERKCGETQARKRNCPRERKFNVSSVVTLKETASKIERLSAKSRDLAFGVSPASKPKHLNKHQEKHATLDLSTTTGDH